MVKQDINSVEVHPQLSCKGHPMDGELVATKCFMQCFIWWNPIPSHHHHQIPTILFHIKKHKRNYEGDPLLNSLNLFDMCRHINKGSLSIRLLWSYQSYTQTCPHEVGRLCDHINTQCDVMWSEHRAPPMELEKATDIRPLSLSAGKSKAFFPHWRAASASNNK